ncbi:DUF2505 family protein [Streptomyces sp. NPDC057116]|uniref:DUF2505 family protein n=1 Tax=Streptomyces sp. NPDC057116 TaxID=3346023 RepID=UPI0036414CD5
MPRFRMVHELPFTPERAWEQFLDHTFNEQFYQETLGWPQWSIEEQSNTGDEVVRKVKMTPRRELPERMAKVLGSNFHQMENGTFTSTSRTGRWRRIPSSNADKWQEEGDIQFEPIHNDGCRMTIEVLLQISIFGIGGKLEDALEKQIRGEWEHFKLASLKHG